jgi:hypothetical protein
MTISTVKIGDLFKSYDFSKEVKPDCYMIGVVENIDGPVIEAKIIKQFFAGDVIERPEALKDAIFRTPIQGKGMFDDRDTRIELIVTKEELQMVMEA